ncbi:MAG: hypothetical protein K0R66_1716 [Gammaproteobacteria bacterium]|jgi:hypothetical protein|nr:hypothetical protein [Gammaproteobacteria bacterium]
MQGKRISPAPKEQNLALVILREVQSSQSAERHSQSVLSAAYKVKQEQCCVVQ